jgi:hypothetical protein
VVGMLSIMDLMANEFSRLTDGLLSDERKPLSLSQQHPLDIALLHPLLALLFELWSPSRQRRSFINNIANTPEHALLIRLLVDVVVGTDDVEFVVFHLGVHVIRDLRC